MEYRLLGRSGLKISTLTLGTMTFGGKGAFAKVGNLGVQEARRLVDLCLDAGVNLIDTADVYSTGACEEIVGEIAGRQAAERRADRHQGALSDGRSGPNDRGLSRYHLVRACEASLKRLKTDVIDLYQVHEWDGQTPLEETLDALDTARASGQGALCRLLQLFRLAPDEGARHQRPPSTAALRQPADPLHARGARGRIRAGADLDRPGARHPGLEPARRRPAVGQAPPQPDGTGRHAPARRLGRAADPRRGAAVADRRYAGRDRRKRATCRPRRWRSPGCSAARR